MIREQVRAAIVAFRLEHGTAPNYGDLSESVFALLHAEPGTELKGPQAVLVDKIPIFSEPKITGPLLWLGNYSMQDFPVTTTTPIGIPNGTP